MEKAMYPSPYIRITQKHGIGSHVDSYAIDEAGSDGGIDFINAPFTGVVKKVYPQDANEVWLESVEPVEYPDGTKDYMTLLFAHCNDVSHLKVGQVIPIGTKFYYEGTKGKASGNHLHLECAKGKFSGTGWHQNSAGYWSINNGKKVDECLWIDDSYHILDTAGYNFKNVKSVEVEEPVVVEPQQPTIEELQKEIDNLKEQLKNQPKKIFTCLEDGDYQIHLYEKEELFIK